MLKDLETLAQAALPEGALVTRGASAAVVLKAAWDDNDDAGPASEIVADASAELGIRSALPRQDAGSLPPAQQALRAFCPRPVHCLQITDAQEEMVGAQVCIKLLHSMKRVFLKLMFSLSSGPRLGTGSWAEARTAQIKTRGIIISQYFLIKYIVFKMEGHEEDATLHGENTCR